MIIPMGSIALGENGNHPFVLKAKVFNGSLLLRTRTDAVGGAVGKASADIFSSSRARSQYVLFGPQQDEKRLLC